MTKRDHFDVQGDELIYFTSGGICYPEKLTAEEARELADKLYELANRLTSSEKPTQEKP